SHDYRNRVQYIGNCKCVVEHSQDLAAQLTIGPDAQSRVCREPANYFGTDRIGVGTRLEIHTDRRRIVIRKMLAIDVARKHDVALLADVVVVGSHDCDCQPSCRSLQWYLIAVM